MALRAYTTTRFSASYLLGVSKTALRPIGNSVYQSVYHSAGLIPSVHRRCFSIVDRVFATGRQLILGTPLLVFARVSDLSKMMMTALKASASVSGPHDKHAAKHSHLFTGSSAPLTQVALTQPVPLPSLWTSVALLVSAWQPGSPISVSSVTMSASVSRTHRHASSLSPTWKLSFWTLGETTTSASTGKWPISAAFC